MKTSSIVAAAVLSVVSLNQAMAGGWIASARPNVVTLTHMIGVPINRAPAAFAPSNRFGPFNRFALTNGFDHRFAPFGQFGFEHSFGPSAFQNRFGRFGFQRPSGFATIVSLGDAGPALPATPAGDEADAPRIIWAPSYVTVIAGGQHCRSAGGPRIIELDASSRPPGGEKLPVVIYGSRPSCA